MKVLSPVPFVRNGHFVWCRAERTMMRRDCQRCQVELYALAIVVALTVAIMEFFGSHYTGSRSLWSDAWHVVFDGLGYLIGLGYATLVTYHLWNPPARERFKVIGELLLGGFLLVSATSIFADSVIRLWVGQIPAITGGATFLVIALLGLIANVVLLLLFWSFGVGHGHVHEHHHDHDENQILRGNFWHTVGDASSSVLVLGTATLTSLTGSPSVRYLDVLGAAVIATLLFWQGLAILTKSHHKH